MTAMDSTNDGKTTFEFVAETDTPHWSEILSRYFLVENMVRGRRVLELGSVDARVLLHLSGLQAARLAATCDRPDRIDRSMLRGRRIEVLAMEVGQLDFDDQSFDVILVPDAAAHWTKEQGFFEELRRVLSADGLCLVGLGAQGRSAEDIALGRAPKERRVPPLRVIDAFRRAFGELVVFRQAPFLGVTLFSDAPSLELKLDARLSAGSEPEPSHIVAVAGALIHLPKERRLVEIPLSALAPALEETTRAREAERARVRQALEMAKMEIARRDASLHAISERLPIVRQAVLSHSDAERDGQAAHRLERLEEAAWVQKIVREHQQPLMRQLAEEKRAREEAEEAVAKVAKELEAHRARGEEERLKEELGAEVERQAELVRERDELRRQLHDARRRTQEALEQGGRGAASHERDDVVALLRAKEHEVARVVEEAERQRRELEARAIEWARRLEVGALEHAEELHRARAHLVVQTQQLAQAERENEALRNELSKVAEEHAVAREWHDEVVRGRQQIEHERRVQGNLRVEVEEAQRRVFDLQAALADARRESNTRDHTIAKMAAEAAAAIAAREAAERAARERATDNEVLKTRMVELRKERDTLAKTSALLLVERDAALSRANTRTPTVEDEASEIALLRKDVAAFRLRAKELEQRASEALFRTGQVLAERARAEAEAAEARGRAIQADGERGRMLAELGFATSRLRALEAALLRAQAERNRAREEAREMDAAARAMLVDLEAAETETHALRARASVAAQPASDVTVVRDDFASQERDDALAMQAMEIERLRFSYLAAMADLDDAEPVIALRRLYVARPVDRASEAPPAAGAARPDTRSDSQRAGVLASVRARCESLEAAVLYRDAEIQRLRSVADKALSDTSESRAEMQERANEARASRQRVEELMREVLDLRRELSEVRQAARAVAMDVAPSNERVDAERAALEAEVRRLRVALRNADDVQRKLAGRIAELESESGGIVR